MKFFKKNIAIFLLSSLSVLNLNAQIRVHDKNSINSIQAGNTYVIVNDYNFPQAEEFLKVFKKYWTISKSVQFIKPDEIKKTAVEGDSFFSLMTAKQYHGNSNGTLSSYAVINFFLSLWTPKKSYFKKDRQPEVKDMDELAQIELTGDAQLILDRFPKGYNHSAVDTLTFNGNKHILNLSPGMLKLYLQQLTSVMRSGKTADYSDEVTNNEQLKLLAGKMLYCGEANFELASALKSGNNAAEADKIFQDYKFPYKILSDKELSDKLLEGTASFYCLLLVKADIGKVVCVLNSETGELIYLRKHSLGGSLKSGDTKSLYKDISKANK